jgi:hypothetical protein
MQYAAEENHLIFKKEIKMISFGDNQLFLNYLMQNQNKTQFAVLFCETE